MKTQTNIPSITGNRSMRLDDFLTLMDKTHTLDQLQAVCNCALACCKFTEAEWPRYSAAINRKRQEIGGREPQAEQPEQSQTRVFRRCRSTYIDGLHMDGENLHVLFKNGKHYRYRIGRKNLMAMLQAPSWPSYFAQHVRPYFPGEFIEGERVEVFGTLRKRGQR